MLVLTRKEGEKFVIGKEIVITIMKVQGSKVSVGIEADKDKWDVLRFELMDAPPFSDGGRESHAIPNNKKER